MPLKIILNDVFRQHNQTEKMSATLPFCVLLDGFLSFQAEK